jgi:uncharacterized protein involved in exopolysaccharide biosynthesis
MGPMRLWTAIGLIWGLFLVVLATFLRGASIGNKSSSRRHLSKEES